METINEPKQTQILKHIPDSRNDFFDHRNRNRQHGFHLGGDRICLDLAFPRRTLDETQKKIIIGHPAKVFLCHGFTQTAAAWRGVTDFLKIRANS